MASFLITSEVIVDVLAFSPADLSATSHSLHRSTCIFFSDITSWHALHYCIVIKSCVALYTHCNYEWPLLAQSAP